MKGTCAKCGRERDGDRYKVYFANVTRAGVKATYSNLQAKYFFLCNGCARMGKSGIYRAILIIFGLMALPLLGAAFAAMGQDGFTAGLGSLIFGLILLAPAAWAAYTLITAKATTESGQYAALRPAYLEWKASGRLDRVILAVPEMRNILKLHPELALDVQLEQLTSGLRAQGIEPTLKPVVTDADLPLIREYMQFLAQQWWEAGGAEGAICERCNQEIARGSGCLMGSNLYHVRCFDELLQEGDAWLRHDADRFLGPGVLDKAREFAANKQTA